MPVGPQLSSFVASRTFAFDVNIELVNKQAHHHRIENSYLHLGVVHNNVGAKFDHHKSQLSPEKKHQNNNTYALS